jgi:hypothetical protein
MKLGAHPPSVRDSPRTLEVFLEAHRDHVAFVHNSDLYCPTIFVLIYTGLAHRHRATARAAPFAVAANVQLVLAHRVQCALVRRTESDFWHKADITRLSFNVRFWG